jgi:hypothetical protein
VTDPTDPLAALNAALGDRYIIDRELGRGGMATVYLARDPKHERFLALKTLRPEIAMALGRERFLREIKLAARQDAQTFTAGVSGQLVRIRVPLVNTGLSTTGVTMEILAVAGGAPDNATSLGQVTIPASAISANFGTISNPTAWASFNLTSLGINVTQGQAYSFVVRTTSTIAYLYNPEFTLGYPNGSGFRRNFALGATWNAFQDFGFQTFVVPN